jgi:hypothetical protein
VAVLLEGLVFPGEGPVAWMVAWMVSDLPWRAMMLSGRNVNHSDPLGLGGGSLTSRTVG